MNGGSDDDWETDEESLVVVEMSGHINNDWIHNCEGRCKILGLDTDRPVLQVDTSVFLGEYQDTVGTSVLFEQLPEKEQSGDRGSKVTQLKYRFCTHHKLCMKRGFLTEKKDSDKPLSTEIPVEKPDKNVPKEKPDGPVQKAQKMSENG